MNWHTTIGMLLLLIPGNFNRISAINAYKHDGENAYQDGQYERAIEAFKVLVDSLEVDDPSVLLNLANSYFHVSDTGNAAYYYSRVAESAEKAQQSMAYNQLGIIDRQQNNAESALTHFKKALLANPDNDNARYNYELLKKQMQQQEDQESGDQSEDQNQEQEDQEQQDQQKDQQQQDQEQQQQKQQQEQEQKQEEQQQEQQQAGEDSEEKEQGEPQQQDASDEEGEEMQQPQQQSRSEKLEELNLTEEKARMILEAMRNNEMQYLQQMQRKATKRPESGKPDW